MFIVPIVEGHGELDALPALLHRINSGLTSPGRLRVNEPIRVKSGSFVNNSSEFQRYIKLAAAKAKQRNGTVLILLDCDDACPATLGPRLLRDACNVRVDVPMFVALAYREYETWLLAAAASLRGVAGLPNDLEPPLYFQSMRDAKGWLHAHMPRGYDPVRHQAALTSRMDIALARNVPSFERLYRFVKRLSDGATSA